MAGLKLKRADQNTCFSTFFLRYHENDSDINFSESTKAEGI